MSPSRGASFLLAALLVACATPWDPPGLRAHQAALAGFPGQRLFDATPYLLPARGELVEFFCRWPGDRPVPVSLPAEATPHERRAFAAALAAWQGVGLGVRLEPGYGPPPQRGISIQLLAPDETLRAEGTGYTIADCRLDGLAASALAGATLPARLERARIHIVRRESEGWSEADHAFFAGEVAGVALHELAHALGFQGHARFGGGILAPGTRDTTPVGRRVLRGDAFDEPTLRALYALPSGVVLRRLPVPAVRTGALDALRVPAAGVGPFVRVGDRSGRVFWRTAEGAEVGVTLVSVATARSRPERLVLLPD